MNYEALDYSNKKYWYKNEFDDPNKKDTKVDVIFFNGTSVTSREVVDGIIQVGEGMKGFYDYGYPGNADVFSDNTRMFVPFYRQISIEVCLTYTNCLDAINAFIKAVPFADICAMMDFYFKNYNNDRPFILAGFSQGGMSVQALLGYYFSKEENKHYLDRMIAAYSIGCGVDKDWLKKLDYLKFASGEFDTGVVISWNTEGPGGSGASTLLPPVTSNALVINPINWKTDNTYAPKEECLGSFVDGKIVSPGLYNLQIDHNRGCLVCDNNVDYVMQGKIWGGKSLHLYEIKEAYLSIRKNMHDRIDAYFSKK